MFARLLKARLVLLLALATQGLGPALSFAQQTNIVYHQVSYTNAHPCPICLPPPWDDSGYPIFSSWGGGSWGGGLVLDLDGDGQPDVEFADDDMSFYIYGFGSTRVLTYPPVCYPYGCELNSWLPVLGAGTVIGPVPSNLDLIWRETVDLNPTGPYSATYNACIDIGYPEQACSGFWQGVEGYTGVEFYISNEVHYAWIHVGVPFIGLQGGYVREYAYETRPNTPIIAGAGKDSDHDGVWDYLDQCPNTTPGAVVDTNGCSIAQLCPCNGPWKNHGEYVKTVESVAAKFVQEGRITEQQRAAIVKQAANSDCGKHR